MQLPDLNELLKYQNSAVLKLYRQNYPHNELPAEQAFEEVLKYLWLTRKHEIDRLDPDCSAELPEQCIMLRSMREIDEMWHEFILFTQDYMDFCQQYFGSYLHHLPNIFDNAPRAREEENKDIEKLLPYIYDHLGEETLRLWFAPYLKEN